MNPNAPPLARDVFSQAMRPGPTYQPTSVVTVLDELAARADDFLLDVGEFENALDVEFPWRNQLVFQSRSLQPEEIETWIQVIRWLAESLLDENVGADRDTRRIRVMLSALGALDVGREGLSVVADRFVGSDVKKSLSYILQTIEAVPQGLDLRAKEWIQEASDKDKAGNFRMLKQALRIPQPRCHSDVATAVFLLWKLEPAGLARLIDSQENILMDILVSSVLREAAPRFSLQVESVKFKFISLSWLETVEHIASDAHAPNVLVQLLLQIAQTPHWKAWLLATYEYPEKGSSRSKALVTALAQLAESQWKDFVAVLSLSTVRGLAEAVADIL